MTNQTNIIDQQKKDNKAIELKTTQIRGQVQDQPLKKSINDKVISKRSILDSEKILESNKKSSGYSGKVSGTDVLSLHYIIIDGLTSSWREFLALQEMSSKVQLAQCVLTAAKKESVFELSTPTESQSDEGPRYVDMIGRTLLCCTVLYRIALYCSVLHIEFYCTSL